MTARVHEKLIFDGEETSMAFCPPLPDDHPRIVALSPAEAGRGGGPPVIFSTACRRGYIGAREIKDGRRLLADVRGRYRMTGGEPIHAEWFSGVIRVPGGGSSPTSTWDSGASTSGNSA